jgi:hypothetical protein
LRLLPPSVFTSGADRGRQGPETGTLRPQSSGRVAGWAELTPDSAGGSRRSAEPVLSPRSSGWARETWPRER